MEAAYVSDLINNAVNQLLSSNPFLNLVLSGGGGSSSLNFNYNLNDYCQTVIVLKADRISTYTKAQQDREKDLILFSNQVARILGPSFPVDYTDILNQALQSTQFIQIFLGEIFFTVIVILSGLAIILIYSLLLSNVELKTFEYGMLRSLGMDKPTLIWLLVFQALYFSIPAILIGLLSCYILYIPIDYVLSQFATIPLEVNLPSTTIILVTLLGLILPILGTLVPIRRALTKTLRDALDILHIVVYETSVSMQKLQDIGLSLTESSVAFILIIVGFLVYYIVPLAFAYNNLALFFRVLTIILLGMVVGQVLVGQIIHHQLEKLASFLIIWGSDRKLRHLVVKNLASHLRRNRRAALMFSLCLAYVCFASTMFTLQANSLANTLSWLTGADISVVGTNWAKPLPEIDLRVMLDAKSVYNGSSPPIVQSFTFLTVKNKQTQ